MPAGTVLVTFTIIPAMVWLPGASAVNVTLFGDTVTVGPEGVEVPLRSTFVPRVPPNRFKLVMVRKGVESASPLET